MLIITLSKMATLLFFNNSVKNSPIIMIFGKCSLEKIFHQQLIHLPIRTASCSRCTLRNPKISSFNNSSFRFHFGFGTKMFYFRSRFNYRPKT